MSVRRLGLLGLSICSLPLFALSACGSDSDGSPTGSGGTSGRGGGGGATAGRAGSGGATSHTAGSGGKGAEAGEAEQVGEGGTRGDGEAAGASGEGGAGGAADQEPTAVTLNFAARVGDLPFDCTKTYSSLGTAGFSAQPLDFRFYVHSVKLTGANGLTSDVALSVDGTWQSARVALLDFENHTGSCTSGNSATNTVIKGTVEPGHYTGVSFVVGVPFDLNHADQATATPPLDESGLWWGWAVGYRFMRLDFQPQPLGDVTAPPTYFFHLGATECVGANPDTGQVTSCGRPDLVTVALDDFDAAKHMIVIDYAKLVEYSNLGINSLGAPGCMSELSDPDCVGPYAHLGLDLVTGQPSGTQSVFSVQ